MNHRSLGRLQLALLAGGLAALLAVPAQASVVQVDLAAAPLAVPANLDGIYLNVITGVHGASQLSVAGWDINIYSVFTGLNFFTADGGAVVASGTDAAALSVGAVVNANSTWSTGELSGLAFRITGQPVAGFRFTNEVTGQINYGWLQLSTTGGNGFPAAIVGYAYENTGLGLLAGTQTSAPVPEPASAALMAAGLLAVLTLSRYRRA